MRINDESILNATSSEIVICNNVTISVGTLILVATYDTYRFNIEGDESMHTEKLLLEITYGLQWSDNTSCGSFE